MNPLAPLDHVVELIPGRLGRALRAVPSGGSLFESHFPRFPVLPGVLLVGGLAALAGQVLGGPDGAWRLARLERVRFRHYVAPGDRVEFVIEVMSADADEARLAGRAEVDGRAVALANLTMRRCGA